MEKTTKTNNVLSMNHQHSPRVYEYTDYRKYLADWCDFKKCSTKYWSYRQFSKQAQLPSPNYVQRIVNTKIKISQEMAERICDGGPKLKGKEKSYFKKLVDFNQLDIPELKLEALKGLERIEKRSKLKQIQDKNIRRRWYYGVIWELATCVDLALTAQTIVKVLEEKITKAQAKEGIDFLLQAGFLKDLGNDRYQQLPVDPVTVDEISSPQLKKQHQHFLELAQEKILLAVNEREFQGLSIALSDEASLKLKQKIKDFINQIQEEFSADPRAQDVWRVQLQLFPITKNPRSIK